MVFSAVAGHVGNQCAQPDRAPPRELNGMVKPTGSIFWKIIGLCHGSSRRTDCFDLREECRQLFLRMKVVRALVPRSVPKVTVAVDRFDFKQWWGNLAETLQQTIVGRL